MFALATAPMFIAGCAGMTGHSALPGSTTMSLFALETAVYDWTDDRGELVAHVAVNVMATPDYTTVTLAGATGLAPPRFLGGEFTQTVLNGTYVFDTATGTLIEEEHRNVRAWPLGIHAWLPNAGFAVANDYVYGGYSEQTARAFVPIGPQWPLLAGLEGTTTWGEASIDVHWDGDQWAAEGSVPCQSQCYPLPGQQGDQRVRYEGTGALPETIEYTWPGTNYTLVGTHTGGSRDGKPIEVTFQAPSVQTRVVVPGACNGIPCEGDAWPDRLSLEAGHAAVQSSPNWLAWSPSSNSHPYYFVAQDGDLSLNGAAAAGTRNWLFRYVDAQTLVVETFSAASFGTPGNGVPGPPISGLMNPSQDETTLEIYREPAAFSGLRPLPDYVSAGLEFVGTDLNAMSVYQLSFASPVRFPDERGSVQSVFIGTGDGFQGQVFFSATTGQLLHVRMAGFSG